MKARTQFAGAALSLCVLVAAPLFGCAASPQHRSTGQIVDDSAITAKVKTKLLSDSITEGLKVDVNTDHGTVQLSGFVDSTDQSRRAVELAQNTAGVKSVENDLIVR